MSAPASNSTDEEIARIDLVDDEALSRIARILGPASAAAKALVELRERREAGGDPICFRVGRTLFVGPDLRNA